MADTASDEIAPPAKEQQTFSLQIFQTLDQAQSGHGIPHKDFGQYAQYLTKRLSRVRHVKAVRSTLVHNHKYVEGVSGRRHAYATRNESPATVENVNVVWNLFYQAERAWAVACEKQQSQSASKQNLHSVVQRRLNKAVKFATQLEDLSVRCCDEQTVVECQVYAAWMKANAALEHKKYATAYQHYKKSMNGLLQLADNVDIETSPDGLALRDVWTTRAETVLRPLVRFCQYEAKDEIVQEETSQTAAAVKTVQPTSAIVLSFRGKNIALDSYKQLKVLYLKMESILADTSHLDELQFLQLLSDLDDALGLVQVEHSHYDTLSAGPAVTAKREELLDLKGYFQYQKLAVSRQQQEARIKDLTQDAEIVHVYDALQQNTVAMAALPGGSGNDSNVEDDPFYLEAQAHVVRIRAFRCYYLARLYESTLGGTPQQVLALLRQAKQLTVQAREEIAACDMDDADIYFKALVDLASKIQALMTRAEALRYLQTQAASGGSSKSDRPLWLRLDDLDAGSVLADDPPLTIPMPCKPAFYDVAWQYVGGEFPMEELDEYIATHEPKSTASGGILSWFSSSKS